MCLLTLRVEGVRAFVCLPRPPRGCYGSDSGFSWVIQALGEAQQEAWGGGKMGTFFGEGSMCPRLGSGWRAEGIWTLKPGLGSLSAGTMSK